MSLRLKWILIVGAVALLGGVCLLLGYAASIGWPAVAAWFSSKYAVIVYVFLGIYAIVLGWVMIYDYAKD